MSGKFLTDYDKFFIKLCLDMGWQHTGYTGRCPYNIHGFDTSSAQVPYLENERVYLERIGRKTGSPVDLRLYFILKVRLSVIYDLLPDCNKILQSISPNYLRWEKAMSIDNHMVVVTELSSINLQMIRERVLEMFRLKKLLESAVDVGSKAAISHLTQISV